MTKLAAVLKKAEKLNIAITKQTHGVTDFYYFTIDGKNFEFTNQPSHSLDASCLCRTFGNGSSPSFYNSFNQLLKMHVK